MINQNAQNENVTFESLPKLMVELLNEVRLLQEKIDIKNPISLSNKKTPEYLYSIVELANFLDISPTTAQALKNSGKIRYSQFGRKLIFSTAEIIEDLGKQTIRRKVVSRGK